VRVPFIARWPGKVTAGRVCNELFTGLDLLPTIARLIGSELPKSRIDGIDLLPLLLGRASATGRKSFAYYSGSELQAVRSGRWKLHFPHDYLEVDGSPGKDGKPANHERMKPDAMEESGIRGIASRHGYRVEALPLSLFDLEADPGERTNVAKDHPEIVQALSECAEAFRADLGDALQKRTGAGVRPVGESPF
jgi:arylsulfatase